MAMLNSWFGEHVTPKPVSVMGFNVTVLPTALVASRISCTRP
jgi:hypothetical protein